MTETVGHTFDNFSGGFTDYYVNGPQEKAKKVDNLLIVQHGQIGKLFTRAGSQLYDAAHPQIPPGNQRIGFVKLYLSTLFVQSARSLFFDSSGWSELVGPTSNKLYPASVTVSSQVSGALWNKHLFLTSDAQVQPQKVYQDGSSTFQLRTAGLPRLASSPTCAGNPPAAKSFLYRFIYEYTYTSGSLTFLMLGPVVEVAVTNGNANNSISAIPVLANGADGNYDTAAMKVGIYRTIDGGTDFFKIGQVTNGTTTFADTVSDAALVLLQPLYTTGGVVEYDQPLKCKLVHVAQNTGYYANVKEANGDVRGNRLQQSVPGIIDASPATFFADVDEDIIGLSSIREVPILLCENSAYRVDGQINELGQGALVPYRISTTCSCVSGQSVVQTLEGVFWAGADGFYYTDGYTVIKLNEDWDQTYATFAATATQRSRIQGKYDPVNRRVWWTIQGQGASDVDRCVVLELKWGIRPKASFVTVSGGQSFAPSAIEFSASNLIRADKRGYVFQHLPTLYTDPTVNTAVSPSTWGTSAIIYDFESVRTNFGENKVRKFIPWISVQAANQTNLSLQIVSDNDDGRVVDLLQPIHFTGNLIWGDPTLVWGDASLIWNALGLIEEKRRFVNLRTTYKGINLTNAYVIIYNSDVFGKVSVDNIALTATLTTLGANWPASLDGYFISFEGEGLTRQYQIVSQTGATVTFLDPGNHVLFSASERFEIKGYPKNEVLNLISYTLNFAAFGETQKPFTPGELNKMSGT